MLVVQNRRFRKQFVVGGGEIFGSLLKFLVRSFTSQAAKKSCLFCCKRGMKSSLRGR